MTQKHYDLTFHYFRAFAIVSVMLTHMWVGPVLAGSEDAARLQDSLRLCLFHSATIYFVFISGYLFDFVNRRKGPFSPLRFYKSKIVNVFCPYLVLSLLLLAAGWVSHHWFGYDIPFINDGTPVASPGDVLRCLAYGSASLVPYWYIPFIMTVFSAGPLICPPGCCKRSCSRPPCCPCWCRACWSRPCATSAFSCPSSSWACTAPATVTPAWPSSAATSAPSA